MARAKEARLSGPQGECLNRANQPTLPPSSSRNPIFTTTRNWVTWLFSTTASNSLAQTDWMLRIVRDARSTVCRTASSKLSEDRPDSSMNFATDMVASLELGPAMVGPDLLE